jgi:hypothetical protein
MESRAFMLARRLPRLLRPIFDLPPSVNATPASRVHERRCESSE